MHAMSAPTRIAVTGAGGQICYSLLFRIAAGGLFGPDQPVELSLLETPDALPKLDALQMELFDCAFPLLTKLRASGDPFEAFEHAAWVILIGGAGYRRDMTRPELLRANGPIFVAQGRAINEASPAARVLVVANPCNTNCLIALSVARDVPREHWFTMTRLDQNRARALIAEKAGVSPDRVTRVIAWGNHSPSVYPDFHNAFIDDRPAHEVIHDREWVRRGFEPTVCGRGHHILNARGAAPAASAAQAIIGAVRSIVTPTHLDHRFSMAVLSDGSYGIPRGLVFGFPLRTEDGHTWSIVPGLFHDDYALERLAQNVAELEQEATIVTDLLGAID
jgi:malate dehydrogenase